MKKMTVTAKRIAASILAAVVLLASVPMFLLPVTAAEDTRVTDRATMDDWQMYFGEDVLRTTNAGRVWTDKSVFVDDEVFDKTGVTLDGIEKDSFLVALSAIASNKTVSGYSNHPTDTVMVLDVSGSMNGVKAKETVAAANAAIEELFDNNPYNRVSVVVYAGDATHENNDTAAQVILPLGRYITAKGSGYLQYIEGDVRAVGIDEGVRFASDGTPPRASLMNIGGATYMQKGLILGMDQLLTAQVSVNDPVYGAVNRIPVMMLLSDGAPTLASSAFTDPGQYDLGGEILQTSDAKGFVTQLTASYVKAQIEAHYQTDCRFYTLGFVVDHEAKPSDEQAVAHSVLKPEDSTVAISGYWTRYQHLADGESMAVAIGEEATDVTKIAMPLERYYVDDHFEVSDQLDDLRSELETVFSNIVGQIRLQSEYRPTLVETNEDYDGYVSFVDRIGRYMEVTDIKGILLDDVLFSGEILSKNFVPGGGNLGTFDEPTALGHEMVAAVRERIGLETHEEAAALIGLAYQHGQIAYDKETGEFSNYIGWYANADGEFLGFWYDGMTTMPDASDETLAEDMRPAYIMKSYGFLGQVNEEYGVAESDMMYVIVQERREIASGDTLMAFGIPASLIPLVTYHVELAEDNATVKSLSVSGAEHPMRLVYEVALRDDISEYTVGELVDEDYPYRDADGNYRFFANQWEESSAYGTKNAYSYFVPSKQNERYYYTEDTLLYEDTNGTLYSGTAPDTSADFYRAFTVYTSEEVQTVYEKMSASTIALAKENADGYWYIPSGTVRTYTAPYTIDKTDNLTDTLANVSLPFVDARYNYYVGATFGNNGVVTVTPATGMVITNTLTESVKGADNSFSYTIRAKQDTSSAQTLLLREDGTQKADTLRFTNREASVTLKNGEQLFIVGLRDGDSFEIRQDEHDAYSLYSVNDDTDAAGVTLTIQEKTYEHADFVNAPKAYGNLIVVERVVHPFGDSYAVPNTSFTVQIDLGEAFAEHTFEGYFSSKADAQQITADEKGRFQITLSHGQRFELLGLPEETAVTVTQIHSPDGFTPTYYTTGVLGDGRAVIQKETTVSVIVANRYEPTAANGSSVLVRGTRVQNDATAPTAYALQAYTDGAWYTVAEAKVDAADAAFDFGDAMASQVYSEPGVYSYRITEMPENTAAALHTFAVTVGDNALEGALRVTEVTAFNETDTVEGTAEGGLVVCANFGEPSDVSDSVAVAVDITKIVENPSGSDLVTLAGYRFGFYEQESQTPAFLSIPTDARGETRLVAAFSQSGVYTYTLKECVPQNGKNGMLYSEEQHTVVITVTEHPNGELTATAQTADGQTFDKMVFTNTYAPEKATLSVPVYKALNGRALREGEFSFRIEQNGTVLANGTNTADGDVVFDTALTFGAVGDTYVDILETVGNLPGVTYDTFVRRVHIHVSDNGDGMLKADYHLINETGETVKFVGRYKPKAASLVIDAEKVLKGRRLINEEFDFLLMENVPDGLMLSSKNRADGSVVFEPIVYTEVGNYEYRLQEAKSGDPNGITYDKSEYAVYVQVTDDGNGALHANVISMEKEGEPVESLVFENTFLSRSTTAVFEGAVTLTGRALKAEEFGIGLYEVENGECGERLQTAYNTVNGTFAFAPIAYRNAGVYRYLVKQDALENAQAVVYDRTEYHLVVYVEDNGHGSLTADYVIMGSNDLPSDSLLFENRYEPKSEIDVVLGGQKILEGRELQAGEFTFLLYEYGDDGTLSSEPIATATNAADGQFVFETLTFTDRSDPMYRIVEDTSDAQMDITYDTTQYDVYISIRKDQNGGLKASKPIITVVGSTTVLDRVEFTNVYTPSEATEPLDNTTTTATSTTVTSTTATATTTTTTTTVTTSALPSTTSDAPTLTTTTVPDTAKPDGAKDDAPYTGENGYAMWCWIVALLAAFAVVCSAMYCRRTSS